MKSWKIGLAVLAALGVFSTALVTFVGFSMSSCLCEDRLNYIGLGEELLETGRKVLAMAAGVGATV